MGQQILISKELLPLAVAGIAAVSAAIGALLTHRFTKVREEASATRQRNKDKLEATRSLYEEAIAVLDAHMSQKGLGDDAHGQSIRKTTARIELSASDGVRTLFSATANLINQWAAHAREAEPQKLGNGMVMITSHPGPKMHGEEAKRLAPDMWAQFEKLKRAMAEEIRSLEFTP